jgi:hypothetical protein
MEDEEKELKKRRLPLRLSGAWFDQVFHNVTVGRYRELSNDATGLLCLGSEQSRLLWCYETKPDFALDRDVDDFSIAEDAQHL